MWKLPQPTKSTLKSAFFGLPCLVFFLVAGKIYADPDRPPARLKSWMGDVSLSIVKTMNDGGLQITNSIFDAVNKAADFNFNAGQLKIGLNATRDVYENRDLLNTWSVVDHFKVGTSYPLYNISGPVNGEPADFSFSIGGNLVFEFMDIRQVSAAQYDSIPNLDAIEEDVKNSDWFKTILAQERRLKKPANGKSPPTESEEIQLHEEDPWYIVDSSVRPRFKRFLNPVLVPFRLPRSADSIGKIDVGEIISYSGTGGVELGGGIGWNFIPDAGLTGLKLNFNYKTYLKGEFRITVLREDERYARVKLSRTFTRGHGGGVGSGSVQQTWYQGLIALTVGNKSIVGEQNFHPIFFNFSVDRSLANIFDVGYRYDLHDPDARDAFDRALRGRFADSQALSDKQGPLGSAVVSRLFERTTTEGQTALGQTFNVLAAYNRTAPSTRDVLETDIQLPDGHHHISRSYVQYAREWDNLFGNRENIKYSFSVERNAELDAKTEEEGLGLIAEGLIEDSNTSAREINRYKEIVESSTGKYGVFPVFPATLPIENTDREKRAHYGRTSFYFGLNLNRTQTLQLANTPKEKMWFLLENAFDVKQGEWATGSKRLKELIWREPLDLLNLPLGLVGANLTEGSRLRAALVFFNRWRKLQALTSDQQRVVAMARLFGTRNYGHAFMKLIRTAFSDQEIGYFITASCSSFGRIQARGQGFVGVDGLLNSTESKVDFGRISGLFQGDATATVTDINIKKIDESKIELRFKLSDDPKILLFRIIRNNQFRKLLPLAEIVFINQDHRFKAGLNTLVLDKNLPTGIARDLADVLEPGNFYMFNLGMSKDNQNWGHVESKEFYFQKSVRGLPTGK